MRKLILGILVAFLSPFVSNPAWSNDVPYLDGVVVSAERGNSLDGTSLRINMYGNWGFQSRYISDYDKMNDISYHAFLNSLSRAASVCGAGVSDEARQVTSNSNVMSRWLAAQEVFSRLISRNMIASIIRVGNGAGIMIDNKKHILFDVTYSDGSLEGWLIPPGHLHTSVKLLDEPVAGSLRFRAAGLFHGCRTRG